MIIAFTNCGLLQEDASVFEVKRHTTFSPKTQIGAGRSAVGLSIRLRGVPATHFPTAAMLCSQNLQDLRELSLALACLDLGPGPGLVRRLNCVSREASDTQQESAAWMALTLRRPGTCSGWCALLRTIAIKPVQEPKAKHNLELAVDLAI